jgi:hypothetical protein
MSTMSKKSRRDRTAAAVAVPGKRLPHRAGIGIKAVCGRDEWIGVFIF